VVLDAEAGPQPVLQALQASGVRTLNLPASTSPTEAIATVRSLGQALGASNTDILANALQVGFDSLSRAADARATKPSILVLYARGGPERLFMLGRGTVAHNISSLLGARQAATFEGSKPLAPEAVLQAAPEWLLMPAETYNSLGGAEGIKLHTLLGNTPAGRHGKVLVVPDGALFGFGPSTLQVIRNLKRAMNARN
jgi:iron complex transport system substrate-binding protein